VQPASKPHEPVTQRFSQPNIFIPEHPVNSLAEQPLHETGSILGLAPLLKAALSGADLAPLANQWIERIKISRNANTLLDLSTVLELLRNREMGLAIRGDALKIAQHFRIASAASDVALKLLVLKVPGDLSTNTPVECLLEDTNIAMELLFVGPGLPLPEVLPEHDLLFVAIAESNENRPILRYLHQRLSSWPRPHLNAPREILKLERDNACTFLSSVPGVLMPRTERVDRETVQALARAELQIEAALPGGYFPLTIRPVDSHAGRGLIKAESLSELLDYLKQQPAEEFFISRFIDYKSADGLYRKYRIVIINGRPFLCHMGISEHWMVHYPYPEMISNPMRREEEERVMATFDEGFARRHQRALAAIPQQIQLDYLGLDCAESKDGDLVIFEVASAMLAHAMDNAELFPYKEAQMHKIFSAFRAMLISAGNKTEGN
jgi:glutathione synthase/RimK-type ligase-like ATP-grasp enzyme